MAVIKKQRSASFSVFLRGTKISGSVLALHKHRAGSVLVKLFQKLAVSKGGALVALRRGRNTLIGVSFLLSFFLCASFLQRKKRSNKLWCAYGYTRKVLSRFLLTM